MGYTIYWKWKGGLRPDAWIKRIQKKVEMKYREALVAILVEDGETLFDVWSGGGSLPLKNEDDYFHESFSGSMLNRSEFHFCKTARKVYDKAVKLALVEAQKLSGNVWRITCDEGGSYTEDTVLVEDENGTWLPSELVSGSGV